MTRRSDIVFFFAMLVGIYAAWLARDVLLLIYVSALAAVVISPAIHFVMRVRIGKWSPGRGIAILTVILAGLVLMGLLVGFALPPIVRDAQAFAADWPNKVAAITERFRHLPLTQHIDPSAIQGHVGRAVGGALGFFTGLAGGLMSFFSWLILTAYFIIDGDRAFHWAMSLLPSRHRDRLRETLFRAQGRVRNWLIGQLALMLILGVATGITFGLLGIKYAYALAVFAGLANIVPIVGPLISVILAGVVAAFDSWTKLLGVLIFYLVYQQVENAFLTPRIMKSTVDLPALAIIIALSLGGALAGIIGALIAVPTAALVAVLVDEYLAKPHRDSIGFAPEQTEVRLAD